MNNKYFKQDSPFRIPTKDKKIIAEHFGNSSTKTEALSIAHMIAPPGWKEAYQCPEFDEYVIMVKGKKMIEIGDKKIILNKGESMVVCRDTKVRYSNPFNEHAEYWSICIPAFSAETVHREEEIN